MRAGDHALVVFGELVECSLEVRQLLQDRTHRRGILLVAPLGQGGNVQLGAGGHQRGRAGQRLGEIPDNLQVFLPDVVFHGGRVVIALDHQGAAHLKHPRGSGPVADDPVDQLRVEAGLHAEDERFRGGHVVDGHQQVGDIFHLAAVVAVQQTISDPIESAMINDIGTINVLETARAKNVKRVVLASSCAVYGDDPRLPKNETMTPRPASPYAVHKLSAEHYARVYFELFGLETVSLRFFNVYGPRQDPSSPYSGVISIFMANAVSNQVPVIYGDGNQSRDFVYVKDVVKANLLAAGTDNLAGNVLNVGTGSDVRINRLWEMIAGLGGLRLAARYEPARSGDILHSVAGMELTQSILSFNNDFTLEQGLQKTFDWYRDQRTDDRWQETDDRWQIRDDRGV